MAQTALAPAFEEAPARVTVVLGDKILNLAPSLNLLHTSYPAEAIWRAVVDGDDASLAEIDVSPTACCIAIWRHGEGAAVARLGATAAAFVAALLNSGSVEQAISEACQAKATADPIAAIAAEVLPAGFVRLGSVAPFHRKGQTP